MEMTKKKHSRAHILIILAASFLYIASATILFFIGQVDLVKVATLGFVLGLVNILFSYYSITWTFTKSSTVFYGVIFSGIIIRFSVFLMVFSINKV